jgi:hypothetical protein
MLSTEEYKFLSYWEKNRLRRKKTMRQFLLGIPAGLLIVVPIVISFSSGWYRRANMEANNQDFNPMVLFVALLLIVGFTAIFYQKHQWDQLEQRYQELLARQTKQTKLAQSAMPDPPGPAVNSANQTSSQTPDSPGATPDSPSAIADANCQTPESPGAARDSPAPITNSTSSMSDTIGPGVVPPNQPPTTTAD